MAKIPGQLAQSAQSHLSMALAVQVHFDILHMCKIDETFSIFNIEECLAGVY